MTDATHITIEGVDVIDDSGIDQYQVCDRVHYSLKNLGIDDDLFEIHIGNTPIDVQDIIVDEEQLSTYELPTLLAAWTLVDNDNPSFSDEQRRLIAREMHKRLQILEES